MRDPTSIQTQFFIEPFKAPPEEVVVCGFAEPPAVSSADRTRERALNDNFDFPANPVHSESAIIEFLGRADDLAQTVVEAWASNVGSELFYCPAELGP